MRALSLCFASFDLAVYADGGICLDILQNQWSPIYDVSAILTSIQSLLSDPNPNSPANSEVGGLAASPCIPSISSAAAAHSSVAQVLLPRPQRGPTVSQLLPGWEQQQATPCSSSSLPNPSARALCSASPLVQAARLYNEDRKEYNRRVKAVVEASWADDGEDDDEGGDDDE